MSLFLCCHPGHLGRAFSPLSTPTLSLMSCSSYLLEIPEVAVSCDSSIFFFLKFFLNHSSAMQCPYWISLWNVPVAQGYHVVFWQDSLLALGWPASQSTLISHSYSSYKHFWQTPLISLSSIPHFCFGVAKLCTLEAPLLVSIGTNLWTRVFLGFLLKLGLIFQTPTSFS